MLTLSAGFVVVAAALLVLRLATGRGGGWVFVAAMVLAAGALALSALARRRSLPSEDVDLSARDS